CGSVLSETVNHTVIIRASYQSCVVGQTEDQRPIMKLYVMGSTKLHEIECPVLGDVILEAGEPICRVPSERQVACGGLGITETDCRREGCCFAQDNSAMPCYYSDTVTLGCSKNGQFVLLLEKMMTKPPLDLKSVYLKGGSGPACKPVKDSPDVIVFKFPVSACGTRKQVEGDSVFYETDVMATRQVLAGPKGKVTRDSLFRLTVQCRYNGSDHRQLEAVIHTLTPPLPATDEGHLRIELRIAKGGAGSQYSVWYSDADYPLVKFLREPVFVEVRILGRTDPSIVLMLEDCWATPNKDPLSQVSWNILVDGCPFTGDNYQTVLHKVSSASRLQFPSHHKRFEVKTFVFMDELGTHPLSGEVYIHCSAAVCRPSAEEFCRTACEARRKRNVAELTWQENEVLVSSGPVVFL
uniref:Zona pellucida sperm-binding protein 4 n=1 Tax=Latimeria chalumnae TaxID=7897 RepID=H3ASC4_LATCH